MGQAEEQDKRKELSKLTKEEWREFTKTVWYIANVSDPRHPAVFPEEIPRRLIKLFTFVGETVLDPFAGIGTTAKAALALSRNAICVEQNVEYVEIMRQSLSVFKPALFYTIDNVPTVQIFHGDSRDMHFIPDESVHLIVTSPPYWNKANYGSSPTNIGNINDYNLFLSELRRVFKECYRVLFPGRKICVVTANVNQYTDEGLIAIPLAADFVNLLREVGFLMVTEIIWSKDRTGGRWGSAGAQRPIFGSYPYPPNFLFKTVHEHILVFRKPGGNNRKKA